MRMVVLSFAVLFICFCSLSEELAPLDPSRPMYQMKDGFPSKAISWPILGGLQECRLPDPQTVEELKEQLHKQDLRHAQEIKEQEQERDIKQKEFETFWGGVLKIAGWAVFAIGVALHCSTNIGPVKSWGSSMVALGLAGVLGGLGIQKTVQADNLLTVAFWGALGIAVMWKARKWSVSKLPVVEKYVERGKDWMHHYKNPKIERIPEDGRKKPSA